MRHLMIGVIVVVMCCFGSLSAQGFYIGAGIGNSFYGAEFTDLEDQANKLDENATGYKFFGGFSLPSIFAVEGGYRSLGTVSSSINDYEFESKTTGWDVYGMGRFEVLMILDLFAKAGVFFWDTENVIVEEVLGNSGTAFAWGLGAGVHLGPVGVRLEWENFQLEETDVKTTLSMLTLSATYGF